MTEPIDDPEYWSQRLRDAVVCQHHAIYLKPLKEWKLIEERHRDLLACEIRENESILDVGCAWGRLLSLLPSNWHGEYTGVDICQDFIEIAKAQNPNREFHCCRAEDVSTISQGRKWDVVVLVSIKQMIISNKGTESWQHLESILQGVCSRILIIEYSV